MAEEEKSEQLKKELGLFGVYAITMGTTLSSGFFLLPGLAVVYAGPALTLAYLIAALFLIAPMLSIIELSTAMPKAGGTYYFLDRSMGPMVGMIGGVGTWLSLVLKTAVALIGMGADVNLVWPELPARPVAVAFALLFGLLNMKSAKHAETAQKILVILLLAILLWFVGGIFKIDEANFAGWLQQSPMSLISAAGLVYISYGGITKVAGIAEEVKNPERNLPWGLFLGVGTALLLYTLGTILMVGMAGADALAGETPVAVAADVLYGRNGVLVISAAAMFAFASVGNAGVLSCSRFPLAMSRDNLLPATLRKISKDGIPINGILLTVGSMLVFLVLLDPIKIAKLASAFQLLLFAFICLAVIVMRESRIDSYDPGFRSPLYPWLHIVGAGAQFYLIAQMGPLVICSTAVVSGIAAWSYFKYASGQVVRDGAIYHIFERWGHKRYEGLDVELRGIMKEKGLRKEDPFDEIVARAQFIDAGPSDTFDSIAQRASALLAERLRISADKFYEGFMRGTKVGATPVSHGAALPHTRLKDITQAEMVLVRCRTSIHIEVLQEFAEGSATDEPIHAIFFLASPEGQPGQHLRILAQIAGRVDDDDYIKAWLEAGNDQDLKEILLRDERYVSIKLLYGSPGEPMIGKALRELNVPHGCLVAMVRRGELTFVPWGNTLLSEGDQLTIIGDPTSITEFKSIYTAS
jgi:amino acid transporter/mannitol/fructose-specific phosphotransferase system IIA component (Ntr-type)